MRILGIDPGLATAGFGVVDLQQGTITPVAHGVFGTKPGPLALRLAELRDDTFALVVRYAPSAVDVEAMTFKGAVSNSEETQQARGAILAGVGAGNLEAVDAKPHVWRSAVGLDTRGGKGEPPEDFRRRIKRETKQEMVRVLRLEEMPRTDHEADALAIAYAAALRLGGRPA